MVSRASSPTAALLTPRGRGAVATIRLHGDVSLLDSGVTPLFHAVNGQPAANQALQRIVFGRWGSAQDGQPPEEIVVCRTASDAVEIHCHGGDAASARILADLERRGCTIVTAFDLMQQQTSTFEAECLDAVSRAVTLRTAAILVEQQSGTLRNAFENLRTELSHSPLTTPQSPLRTELLRWSNFGLHLTQPWRVVLAGRPNVGKSSLINALVGYQRSIVFDEPGTTRDVVTAETALDGWPIQFADTAGLRDVDADDLESAGIELARRQLDGADLRLLVLDISQPRTADDERLLAEWTDALVIANKCDLPSDWTNQLDDIDCPHFSPEGARFDSPGRSPGSPVPPDESAPTGRNPRKSTEVSRPVGAPDQTSAFLPGLRPGLSNQSPLGPRPGCRLHQNQIPPGTITVSARTRTGLDELITAIVARLVPDSPSTGTAVPVTPRQIELLWRIASVTAQHDVTTTARLCDELLA